MSAKQIDSFSNRLRKVHGNKVSVLQPYKASVGKIQFRSLKTGRVWMGTPERLLGKLNA